MPDIGFLELLLIGAIAFLILGPERMPELFGQVGRVVKKGRSWINDIRRQIDEETQLSSTVAEAKDVLNEANITDWNKEIMKQHGQILGISEIAEEPKTTEELDKEGQDKEGQDNK